MEGAVKIKGREAKRRRRIFSCEGWEQGGDSRTETKGRTEGERPKENETDSRGAEQKGNQKEGKL